MPNTMPNGQPPTAEPQACVVVGAGPVGLTAALCLAVNGCPVEIIAPKPALRPERDTRTAALFVETVALLRALGAWQHMEAYAAPLAGIRMADVSRNLLRAPEVLFEARDAGYEAFGFNVPNAGITAGLAEAAAHHPLIRWREARLIDAELADDCVSLHTDDGATVTAKVVIAADGRHSLLRDLSGFATRTWDYEQVAITSRFRHSLPHEGISTELHYESGPCTCVPLPGAESSLVWMERPAVAKRLLAGDGALFEATLRERFSGLLGKITDIEAPSVVPLIGVIAERFGGNRIMLVGETAHAFPPIGAQGLNLGIRDAAEAAGLILDAIADGRDPGSDRVTGTYHRRRWADIQARTAGVNALNESLTGSWPFLPIARSIGLNLVAAVPALKRQLIRQGMTGLGPQPRLIADAVVACVDRDPIEEIGAREPENRPTADSHSA